MPDDALIPSVPEVSTDYVGPEGQRLRKVTGSGTTYFASDAGNHLLAEDDNGAWIDYIWLNGRLVGRIAGGAVDAIHDDQTGRPQVVTDASGAVVWKATNYPFEREVTQDDIGGLNLGFPGQYYDAERWLWNNGYRDYNAGFGRYNESDPVGLGGGTNTYAYVGNNPVAYYDPYGLWSLSFSFYEVWGGGVELTGEGWHVASISFSGGVGIGGGASLDPNAETKSKDLDPCALPGSNAIGLYAKVGFSADGVGAEVSGEGGLNVDGNGNAHLYGGGGLNGPSLSKPGEMKVEDEASAGIVITHYF